MVWVFYFCRVYVSTFINHLPCPCFKKKKIKNYAILICICNCNQKRRGQRTQAEPHFAHLSPAEEGYKKIGQSILRPVDAATTSLCSHLYQQRTPTARRHTSTGFHPYSAPLPGGARRGDPTRQHWTRTALPIGRRLTPRETTPNI